MEAHTLPDGSTAVVEPFGYGAAMVSRSVDGRTVWGQAFTKSTTTDLGELVAGVLGAMRAEPEAFHRWWL